MSRIKQELERQQEVQLEYQMKFMDFVYDNLVSSRLSDVEIDDMERSQQRPLTAKNIIVSEPPLNNPTYNIIKQGEVS